MSGDYQQQPQPQHVSVHDLFEDYDAAECAAIPTNWRVLVERDGYQPHIFDCKMVLVEDHNTDGHEPVLRLVKEFQHPVSQRRRDAHVDDAYDESSSSDEEELHEIVHPGRVVMRYSTPTIASAAVPQKRIPYWVYLASSPNHLFRLVFDIPADQLASDAILTYEMRQTERTLLSISPLFMGGTRDGTRVYTTDFQMLPNMQRVDGRGSLLRTEVCTSGTLQSTTMYMSASLDRVYKVHGFEMYVPAPMLVHALQVAGVGCAQRGFATQ